MNQNTMMKKHNRSVKYLQRRMSDTHLKLKTTSKSSKKINIVTNNHPINNN